jgi:hypothetical protein
MITVHIDEESHQAKTLLEMLRTFSFVEFAEAEDRPRYNEETEQAIKDFKDGKVEKVSLDQLRTKMYS